MRFPVNRFIFVLALIAFMLGCYNLTFWQKAITYTKADVVFLVSLGSALFLIATATVALFAYPYVLKAVSIIVLGIGGASAYFVDTYGIIIDQDMIHNTLETNQAEAFDLASTGMFVHFLLFVILPIGLIFVSRIRFPSFGKNVFQNFAFISICLVTALVIVLINYASFASLFRNHRDLAKNLHPSNPIVSLVKVIDEKVDQSVLPFIQIGTDATLNIPTDNTLKPRLTVLVLGETARAQSFSLNGYERETDPNLKKHKVINFPNVTSCGTSTAVSVPCMFSKFNRSNYTKSKASQTENVLDIIQRAGLKTVWLGNNSSSKGQADRIDYLHSSNFKSDEFCRSLECFDEILISKLKAYVGELESKHTLIVLHQLGSHGPTYYKRVPETLKKFRPECATAELNTCSRDEILNAYDNTIYYTDYILGQLIDFLKTQEDRFETSMLYVSDHGESTGEYGLYLHGMPYAFAPSEQTHVPMFAWLSQEYALSKKIDRGCMDLVAKNTFSHDNLFHTLLNMTDVKTNEYIPEMSVFDGCTGDSP